MDPNKTVYFFVNIPCGRSFIFSYPWYTKISYIQEVIMNKTGINPEFYYMTYGIRVLTSNQTLLESGIKNEDILTLHLR